MQVLWSYGAGYRELNALFADMSARTKQVFCQGVRAIALLSDRRQEAWKLRWNSVDGDTQRLTLQDAGLAVRCPRGNNAELERRTRRRGMDEGLQRDHVGRQRN
jgi:hypothetical protein